MTLKDTFLSWRDYYFPCDGSIFSHVINRCFELFKKYENVEIFDIDDYEVLSYLMTIDDKKRYEYCFLLWQSLKKWALEPYKAIHHVDNHVKHENTTKIKFDENNNTAVTYYPDITLHELYTNLRILTFPNYSYENKLIYDLCWKRLKPLHDKPYRLIRNEDIKAIESNCSASTICVMYRLLTRLDGLAYSHDVIDKLHFNLKDFKYRDKQYYNFISLSDIETLCEYTYLDPVQIALVMLYTGLLVKELLAFNTEWIDLETRDINTQYVSKTFRNRIIPIHDRIYPILKRWKENGIPFSNATNIDYYRHSHYLTNTFRLVGIALLDHELLSRDFRHSFQLYLENTDANHTQIAILLGNQPHGCGGRSYTHPTKEKLRHIINQLP